MKYPCRIDKFISKATGLPRSEAKKALKAKRVQINQSIVSNAQNPVQAEDQVFFDQQPITLQQHVYYMLNKPAGFLSTAAAHYPSALSLVPNSPHQLHAAGRLDVDTTGLLLITSDGQWSHRVTSPKANKVKQYRVSLAEPIFDEQLQQLRDGLILRGEQKPTKPAEVEQINERLIVLRISEGRYHQVKRMCAAVGNKVEALHREKIGDIELDEQLAAGEYRQLSLQEVKHF